VDTPMVCEVADPYLGRDAFDTSEGVRHFQGAYIDVDGVQTAHFRSKYQLDITATDQTAEL
jgi:hypothetical protein